jgi:hypothetical protein
LVRVIGLCSGHFYHQSAYPWLKVFKVTFGPVEQADKKSVDFSGSHFHFVAVQTEKNLRAKEGHPLVSIAGFLA